MTIAQILLLFVCLKYRKYDEAGKILNYVCRGAFVTELNTEWPPPEEGNAGITAQQRLLNSLSAGGPAMKRPLNFWQWKMFGVS